MDGRSLIVLYGSQTGTAQDVADRLVREAKRRHFSAKSVAMDSYTVTKLIEENLVLFVCSTTGQGDPPDNMKLFWRFLLRKDLPPDSLADLQFAVLGLGDSSYQKFNVVGKRLSKRLEQLGATAIHTLGLADDQHDLGIDAVVTPWMEEYFQIVLEAYPLPVGLQIIPKDVCPPPKYLVQVGDVSIPIQIENVEDNSVNGRFESVPSSICPFHARLLSNRRLTADSHFQDVRMIRLDITNSNIRYDPGDVVMIQSQNSTDSVKAFLQLIDLDPQCVFVVTQSDQDNPVPHSLQQPRTAQWLCTNYFDINSVPRRSFFDLLKYHATDEMEKEKLEEFCTPEGQEELFDYCNRVKRTILEILEDFHKTASNIPMQYLFDIIPPLQPRAFSIASSPKAHPNELHILMAVVHYRTKLHIPRKGVCSTWLSSLDPLACPIQVPIWVKKGTIHFPKDVKIPLVMIGPGTGLAPFRSIIHDRCTGNPGDLVLFFGCRSKFSDFYCEKEWEVVTGKGQLKLLTAFSRDQETKIYVQHKLREQGELVWRLLDKEGAYFYIAGNAKSMPDDVKEALCEVICQHGEMEQTQALNFIQGLERRGRFQVEAWS